MWCMFFYVGLLVTVWLVLFIRAFSRSRLIEKVAPLFQNGDLSDEWAVAKRGFWRIFGDARRIGLVQRHLNLLPPEVLHDHKRFVYMTRIAYVLVVALILFAFAAYRFCK